MPRPRRLRILAAAALLAATFAPSSMSADETTRIDALEAIEAMDMARQLVLVTAPDWTSTRATLRRFERADAASAWTEHGAAYPVTLGRSGLGWGLGLHPAPASEPIKREGDGRAPAGVFRLTRLFGYAGSDSALARTAKLPYLPVDSDTLCIDDPASRHYNRIVERSRAGAPDWSSHEDMRRRDDQYVLGVVVAHNSDPPEPGRGSCIFMHVWRAPGAPTAGCTASSLDDMRARAAWLDASRQPLLVQLPDGEYPRRRVAWGLP